RVVERLAERARAADEGPPGGGRARGVASRRGRGRVARAAHRRGEHSQERDRQGRRRKGGESVRHTRKTTSTPCHVARSAEAHAVSLGAAAESRSAFVLTQRAMPLRIEGTYTALVTPFTGEPGHPIDWAAFDALIDAQVAGGVAGLVPCGTTG